MGSGIAGGEGRLSYLRYIFIALEFACFPVQNSRVTVTAPQLTPSENNWLPLRKIRASTIHTSITLTFGAAVLQRPRE